MSEQSKEKERQHAFGFDHYIKSVATHLHKHFAEIDAVTDDSLDKHRKKMVSVLLHDGQEITKEAHVLAGYQGLESLSIGIFGEWGSGKNKLLRGIESAFKDDEKVIPVFFNAWRYEKEPHIIIPLFKTMLYQIQARMKNKENSSDSLFDWLGLGSSAEKKASSLLDDVRLLTFSLLSGLSVEFSGFKFDANASIEQFFKKHKVDELEMMDRLESIYYDIPRNIETVTLAHKVKFLFLIDDLDRCLPENSLKMLEGIKLFLDIPGCAFVLAVDDDVIERGVLHHYREYLKREIRPESPTAQEEEAPAQSLPITGSEYLEKTIQLPFTLPLLHETQVKEFLTTRYKEEHFPDDFIETFAKSVAPVPRKIIRAAELFILKKKLLTGKGIGDHDLLKLVCPELFAPSLFRKAKKRVSRLCRL